MNAAGGLSGVIGFLRRGLSIYSLERGLGFLLVVYSAALPLSSLAQLPGYLIALVFLVLIIRTSGQAARVLPWMAWAVLIFLLAVVSASVQGLDPVYSLGKMRRFLFLPVIWAMAYAVPRAREQGRDLLRACVVAFLISLSFRAALDFIRVPLLVSMGIPLFQTGTMTIPQFYMAGLSLVAGMLVMKAWRLRSPPVMVALAFCLSGLLLHFKRGAWFSALAAAMLIALLGRRWKVVFVVSGLAVLFSLLPPVQERIADIAHEFDQQSGGRVLLWTRVAPELIGAHPLGMGWQTVKPEHFHAVSDRVEKHLKHLHNNMLQITLELGFPGLLAWVFWMGVVMVTFYLAFREAVRRESCLDSGLALGSLAAFAGLLLNGMVEYNFGDSEVFRLMLFLMAIAVSLSPRTVHPLPPR